MARPDTNPSLTTQEKTCVYWTSYQNQGWLCVICQTWSPAETRIGVSYSDFGMITTYPAKFTAYPHRLNDIEASTIWSLSVQGNLTYAVAQGKNPVQVFYKSESWRAVTDYAFIFCGKCPPGYCRAQEALPSPCRIYPGCV